MKPIDESLNDSTVIVNAHSYEAIIGIGLHSLTKLCYIPHICVI